MDRYLARVAAWSPKFAWRPTWRPKRLSLWQASTLTGAAGIVLTLLLFWQQTTGAHAQLETLPDAAREETDSDPFNDLAASAQQNQLVAAAPRRFEDEPFVVPQEPAHAAAPIAAAIVPAMTDAGPSFGNEPAANADLELFSGREPEPASNEASNAPPAGPELTPQETVPVENEETAPALVLPGIPPAEEPEEPAPVEPAHNPAPELQLAQARERPRFEDDDDEKPAEPKQAAPAVPRPQPTAPTEQFDTPAAKAPEAAESDQEEFEFEKSNPAPAVKPVVPPKSSTPALTPAAQNSKATPPPVIDSPADAKANWKRRMLSEDDAETKEPSDAFPAQRPQATSQIKVTAPVPRISANPNPPPALTPPAASPISKTTADQAADFEPPVTEASTTAVRPQARPQLQIQISAPAEVPLGAPVVLQFRFTNTGSAPAHGIVARDVLPPGLRHPQSRELEYPIGTLAPGESRTTSLTLAAAAPGTTVNRATVTADGGITAEASVRLEIRGRGVAGPDRRPPIPFSGRFNECGQPNSMFPLECCP